MPQPTMPISSRVQFGAFSADVQTGELWARDKKIKLEGQPFEVLALLLQKPGQLVTREELQRKLWPSDTFVDFEHSINTAVKRLREVLGDSAETPRFIETLPRRGYRFIYPLDGAAAQPLPSVAWLHAHWRTAAVLAILPVFLAGLLLLKVGGLRDGFLGAGRADVPIRSLAVLPLENLTGDPGQEYMVDGIHDELITQLAQIGSLKVISRTSVLRYKQQTKSLPEIAAELGVEGVVEGAVQRSGDRIHLTVQLISALHDRHLWAQSYDRDSQELSALPREIAESVAGQLKISLTSRERERLASAEMVNAEAYRAYLKGVYNRDKWTNESLWQAIHNFQEALDRDPTYAPAWAGLGICYEWLGGFRQRGNLPRKEALLRANAALTRATELDPTLREPHQALGRMKLADWDWEGGAQEFKRVKELDPVWQGGTLYLVTTGRFGDAVTAATRAAELNPLAYKSQLVLGWTYFAVGRFDESIRQLNKTVEMDPMIDDAYYELGWNYAKKGMHKEAIAECEASLSILRKRQPEAFATQDCGWVYAVAGRRREALEIARNLERKEAGDDRFIQLAHIYDAFGDRARALTFLSRAYEEHAEDLPHQWRTPMLSDELKTDSRFQALIHRTGIPWATFPPVGHSVVSAGTKPPERRQP